MWLMPWTDRFVTEDKQLLRALQKGPQGPSALQEEPWAESSALSWAHPLLTLLFLHREDAAHFWLWAQALPLPFCLLLKTALPKDLRKKGLVILWLTNKSPSGYQHWLIHRDWRESRTIYKKKKKPQTKIQPYSPHYTWGEVPGISKNLNAAH